MLSEEKYYNYRKEIRKLYDNDVNQAGDLCSRVLEIRDKNRCVEGIRIAIQEYNIRVDLSESTDTKKRDSITNKIVKYIDQYIMSNLDTKTTSLKKSDDEFAEMMDSDDIKFCDVNILGNTIQINL